MISRRLGRSGINAGIIGLGAEHLEHESYDVIKDIVDEAIDKGAGYIDLFMGSPDVRDNFGKALTGKRDKAIIAGHLGAAIKKGQYHRTRDKEVCETFFYDLLKRLKTDYIDVLMLHYIDEMADYENVIGKSGVLELALKLKKEGKVRSIGLSSHGVSVSNAFVQSGYIDVLMFPVNPAFDMLPGDMDINDFWKEDPYKSLENKPLSSRKELFHACEKNDVGIVAMKTYAAGWLLKENPSSIVMTPEQCIHYSLSQPGVSIVVPGCKTVEEMKAALRYLDSSGEELDYSKAIMNSVWKLEGACMYCNHCLPCPSGINIAAVTRILDSSKTGITQSLRSKYEELSYKAKDCTSCKACIKRCPFGVDVVSNMEKAEKLFDNV